MTGAHQRPANCVEFLPRLRHSSQRMSTARAKQHHLRFLQTPNSIGTQSKQQELCWNVALKPNVMFSSKMKDKSFAFGNLANSNLQNGILALPSKSTNHTSHHRWWQEIRRFWKSPLRWKNQLGSWKSRPARRTNWCHSIPRTKQQLTRVSKLWWKKRHWIRTWWNRRDIVRIHDSTMHSGHVFAILELITRGPSSMWRRQWNNTLDRVRLPSQWDNNVSSGDRIAFSYWLSLFNWHDSAAMHGIIVLTKRFVLPNRISIERPRAFVTFGELLVSDWK